MNAELQQCVASFDHHCCHVFVGKPVHQKNRGLVGTSRLQVRIDECSRGIKIGDLVHHLSPVFFTLNTVSSPLDYASLDPGFPKTIRPLFMT
jgi:hypothetical protein